MKATVNRNLAGVERLANAKERQVLMQDAAYEIDALAKLVIGTVDLDWRANRGILLRIRKLSHALMWLADPTIAEPDMTHARALVTAGEASHV